MAETFLRPSAKCTARPSASAFAENWTARLRDQNKCSIIVLGSFPLRHVIRPYIQAAQDMIIDALFGAASLYHLLVRRQTNVPSIDDIRG